MYDYLNYAKEVIDKAFSETVQSKMKKQYSEFLHKVENATLDIIQKTFEDAANDFMRDAWHEIVKAVIADLDGYRNCEYLEEYELKNIRESLLRHHKEEIYNDVLNDLEKNLTDERKNISQLNKKNHHLYDEINDLKNVNHHLKGRNYDLQKYFDLSKKEDELKDQLKTLEKDES